MLSHQPPSALGQNNQSDLPTLKALLIANIFVAGDHHIECGSFGGIKQVAILVCVPSSRPRFDHHMPLERPYNSVRNVVIQ